MARTSPAAVRELLDRHYDTTRAPSLTPSVDMATSVVDDLVTAASEGPGTSISDTKLELIERALAAYYYTFSDPLYTSRSTDGASGAFMQESYLKMAKSLDPTGLLGSVMDGVPEATMDWLGKAEADKLTWDDRNP